MCTAKETKARFWDIDSSFAVDADLDDASFRNQVVVGLVRTQWQASTRQDIIVIIINTSLVAVILERRQEASLFSILFTKVYSIVSRIWYLGENELLMFQPFL